MDEEQRVLCWGVDPSYGHQTSLQNSPLSLLFFFKFLPMIGQRGKAGLRMEIQVLIASSSSRPSVGKGGLALNAC